MAVDALAGGWTSTSARTDAADAADADAAAADALGLSIFFDFLISNGEKDKWRCSAGSGRN